MTSVNTNNNDKEHENATREAVVSIGIGSNDDNDVKLTLEQGVKETPLAADTKKKRTAERQIIKGEEETAGEEGSCGDNEESLVSGSFPKASIEKLQGRRMVKARKDRQAPQTCLEPTAEVQKHQPSFNWGAALFSSNGTSTSAGSFGFSTAKTIGFGSIISSSTTSAATASSGFGSFAAAATREESQNEGEDNDNKEDEEHEHEETYETATTTIFSLPPKVEEANGEENEACIMQLRSRLYHLVDNNNNNNNTQSLQEVTNDDAKPHDDSDDHPAPTEASTPKTATTQTKKQESNVKTWKEVGTGPVRILQQRQLALQEEQDTKTTSTRIVQRRESTPGGLGTKVILNIPVRKETVVHRQGDKHVMVSTVANEKTSASVTYLFKVKTIDEANNLSNCLEEAISNAAETSTIQQDTAPK